MSDFLMVMLGSASSGDWDAYVDKLIDSGKFRGGSSLGNGLSISKEDDSGQCTVTGFMRFSASHIDEVKALLPGNPLYEAGGRVEILEEIAN